MKEQIRYALKVLSNRNIRDIMLREARKVASWFEWGESLEKYLECYFQLLDVKRSVCAGQAQSDKTHIETPTGRPAYLPIQVDDVDQRMIDCISAIDAGYSFRHDGLSEHYQ